jgi:dihydrolipoamide dehydrogenase
MNEFDVVVLGAGPGGYVAAIKASQLGLKTAIIEKQWLGGVCLNVGCIPSKALLKNAELANTLRNKSKDFGFSFENLKLDYSVAVKRSRQVSNRLTKGVGFLMKKNNIEVFMGEGKLTGKNKISVKDSTGNLLEIVSKNVILATGAHSIQIPGMEVDGQKVLSYNEAILQESMPESVVIIGAGAIGVEFATIWNGYGSKVTIVEMLPRLVPLEDEEIGLELGKAFKKSGIEILTNHKVEKIEKTETGVRVTVTGEKGEQVIEAQQALMAIGFRPNSKDIGLEAAGVKVDSRGFVEIDDHMSTNVPGIWAIGDLTGKLLLAHVASTQAIICAENIAGEKSVTLDYRMMPRATYCHPQVASFGLTEAQAKEEGFEVKVGRFPFQANGKSLGMGESSGFIKLITDVKYGEILGAHMIGLEVSELLPELTLAQNMELTIEEISRNVHAHPTLSEVIMEAAHDAAGHSLQI